MRLARVLTLAALVSLMVGLLGGVAVADEPSNPYFLATWQRTDQPVADGAVSRTWMWGPEANTGALVEEYADSPGGSRTVQYYDKSRMEITDPNADPNSIWYVTNGLLVVELVSGQMQVGDDSFDTMSPAEVNVAGDASDPNGPTYATFTDLRGAVEDETGATLIETIDRGGNVTTDDEYASQGVTAAYYDGETGHNIASPFWTFMNSSGLVWENGALVEAPLFVNPFYATGRPITEAYWANVLVGGTEKLVLIQCFERRCLTYTPSNEAAWQVEAGNVGQHYYSWRYDSPPPPPTASGQIVFELEYTGGGSDLWSIDADGSNLLQLTNNPDDTDTQPSWSPDGSNLAFAANPGGNWDIYTMDHQGNNVQNVTENQPDVDGGYTEPAWSPDDRHIAYLCGGEVCVLDLLGVTHTQLTAFDDQGATANLVWSPDGSQLAFNHRAAGLQTIDNVWVMNADGSNLTQLTSDGPSTHPTWSPDGQNIAYAFDNAGVWQIWAIPAGGGDALQLTDGAGGASADQGPVWSPVDTTIAFVRSTNGQGDIWTVDYGTQGLTQITDNPNDSDQGPSWSPDGDWLTFYANPAGTNNIFVADRDGNTISQLTTGTSGQYVDPVWAP